MVPPMFSLQTNWTSRWPLVLITKKSAHGSSAPDDIVGSVRRFCDLVCNTLAFYVNLRYIECFERTASDFNAAMQRGCIVLSETDEVKGDPSRYKAVPPPGGLATNREKTAGVCSVNSFPRADHQGRGSSRRGHTTHNKRLNHHRHYYQHQNSKSGGYSSGQSYCGGNSTRNRDQLQRGRRSGDSQQRGGQTSWTTQSRGRRGNRNNRHGYRGHRKGGNIGSARGRMIDGPHGQYSLWHQMTPEQQQQQYEAFHRHRQYLAQHYEPAWGFGPFVGAQLPPQQPQQHQQYHHQQQGSGGSRKEGDAPPGIIDAELPTNVAATTEKESAGSNGTSHSPTQEQTKGFALTGTIASTAGMGIPSIDPQQLVFQHQQYQPPRFDNYYPRQEHLGQYCAYDSAFMGVGWQSYSGMIQHMYASQSWYSHSRQQFQQHQLQHYHHHLENTTRPQRSPPCSGPMKPSTKQLRKRLEKPSGAPKSD